MSARHIYYPFRQEFFLTVFLLIVCSCSFSQTYFTFNRQNQQRSSFEFKLIRNLIIVPVKINNQGPFNFALDTGVGICLLTDPSLKDSLKLDRVRTISITGLGERSNLEAYIVPPVKLEVADVATSAIIPVAILKEDVFDLSSFVGMPVHGLIGYEFFSSFIVRINYDSKVITLFDPDKSKTSLKGDPLPITIEQRKPYIVADVQMRPDERYLTRLIIDTGAGHPLSLESYQNMSFVLPEKRITANLGVGLAGPISGYVGRIEEVSLGKFQLKNAIASFPNYKEAAAKASDVIRNGNLGNGILKRFKVTFDYPHGFMYLKPAYSFREPFEHDMSGLELVAAGEELDRVIIARVEPGSAADEAGLEVGDELIRINFKPIKEMSVEEMDNLLKSRDERNLFLEVLHNNQVEGLILTLKRRI